MGDDSECKAATSWRLKAFGADGKRADIEGEGALDELVVGEWLHLEQMTETSWWARIGDARVVISLEDGAAGPRVDVTRGFYELIRGQTDEHQVPEGTLSPEDSTK